MLLPGLTFFKSLTDLLNYETLKKLIKPGQCFLIWRKRKFNQKGSRGYFN